MKIRMIIDKGGTAETEVQDLLFEQQWEISQKRAELPAATFVLDGRGSNSPLRDLPIPAKSVIIEDYDDDTVRLYGGIGLRVSRRMDGLGAIFTLESMGFAFRLHRKVFTDRFSFRTAKYIIQQVFERTGLSGADGNPAGGEGFDADTFVNDGWQIYKIQFSDEDVASILTALAEISGVSWWIDSFKRLHFREPELEQTNIVIADHDIDDLTRFAGEGITNTVDIYSLVNSVKVSGGYARKEGVTQAFAANGVATKFALNDVWREYDDGGEIKRIEVRVYETGLGDFGNPLAVGMAGDDDDERNLKGSGDPEGDDSIDVLWNANLHTLEFAAVNTPLDRTDAFQVHGDIMHKVIARHEDIGSIITLGGRPGGVWEHTIKDARIEDQIAAELRAMSTLRELSAAGDLWTFNSTAPEVVALDPGQVISIDSQAFNKGGKYVVHSNTIRLLGGEVFQASLDVRRIPTLFIGPEVA